MAAYLGVSEEILNGYAQLMASGKTIDLMKNRLVLLTKSWSGPLNIMMTTETSVTD